MPNRPASRPVAASSSVSSHASADSRAAVGEPNATALTLGPLLEANEPAPYRVVNPDGTAPMLLTCDHASSTIPRSLGSLGLAAEDIRRHIGWDIGAADVTLRLAERFDAPAVLSNYSRLVIDCNRKLGTETSIPAVSDGTRVPGNVGIGAADAARRATELFQPYHAAISRALDGIRRTGRLPVYVAIHSFTVQLHGGPPRPWHFGVLWDEDPRVAVPLIRSLRQFPGILVGDNEPYSGRDHFDFSQEFHASSKGLPSALVEVREDLIRDAAGAAEYARMLGDALECALAGLELTG